jgi:glycosyltransferase involved in cell wall biosynthesis
VKLAFFYPPSSMFRPLDPERIDTDPRGLTGSENSCLGYALGLAHKGHAVEWFTNTPRAATVGPLTIRPYSTWADARGDGWQACIAWMNPAPLASAPDGALRIFNQQCSDFGGCAPGWESLTDFLLPLSQSHASELRKLSAFPVEKYRICWNGVDPEAFRPLTKVPGRCLWASSHDRGLHWLLELWPEIRRRVPHAHLRIAYDLTGMNAFAKRNDPHPLIQELARRSTYEIEMLKRLAPHGVELLGSVSRDQIREEMGRAECLLYPADPARYCETFGVTVLEAMSSGCVPVIVAADAFGELWSSAAPSVAPPFTENRSAYLELVVSTLTDPKFRERYRSACIGHAHRFTWATLVEKFERFMETRGAEGLEGVA